jgi:hypothetical protein
LKKSVIFVALFSVVLFSNCKNNPEASSEEQMEKTVTDSTTVTDSITVTDTIKKNEVAPVVAEKDTLTSPKGK